MAWAVENDKLRCWVLIEEELMEALARAAQGEDPALLVAEFYANAEHQTVAGPDG